jgi:hypothetical protein
MLYERQNYEMSYPQSDSLAACPGSNRDFVEWGFGYVCEVFVLLTGCASLDVLLDPGPF